MLGSPVCVGQAAKGIRTSRMGTMLFGILKTVRKLGSSGGFSRA
jgi:hypothetical protein